MIIVYHQNNKVTEVAFEEKAVPFSKKNIAENLFDLAQKFPDQLIIWCRTDLKSNLNYSKINEIFHHKKIIASYNLFDDTFLPEQFGYIDQTPFIKIKNDISYPTWQISSTVGGVNACVLAALKEEVFKDDDFDYFLHSMAKLAMLEGLLCYSNPLLLINNSKINEKHKRNNFMLFRFVKQHYRTRWVFLLFLNFGLYERKFPVFPLIFSLFYKKRNLRENLLDKIEVDSTRKNISEKTIDVIIPTIGRKVYLYDVLKDLAKQTHLPKNVIIIEQNPDIKSTSELDYITNESWPFCIKHTFTHQTGAVNARNLALEKVESQWVFLNDDDNRFNNDLIEKTLQNIELYACKAALTFYPIKGEKLVNKKICQTDIFGSGNSFIDASALQKVKFNKSLEFGYGEDTEFGLQLRDAGFDIIYFPNLIINHLRAPVGGFRTKPALAWQNQEIQPKPSPTIMYLKLNNLTAAQLSGYKTILFLKYYKVQEIKNPITYFRKFKRQWEASVFWANELKK